MVLYSISHTPLPSPTTPRLAIVSSVAPKERATLSMEQVRPVQEVMAHRLGGHRGQERDEIHLIITIKGLPATRGGVMVLESSWRSSDGWSGQDYQQSPCRSHVVCISVVSGVSSTVVHVHVYINILYS